jgi:basic membrane protein A and related proteins
MTKCANLLSRSAKEPSKFSELSMARDLLDIPLLSPDAAAMAWPLFELFQGRLAVKRIRVAASALLCGLFFATQASADEKLKVAFVEFAQASGASWVRANAEATKYLQDHVPDLDVTRVESVPDGPGVVPVINNLIAKGNKVIFANSYGYGTFIPEIAKKHPEVFFIVQMADPKGPKNVASYYGKLEEVRYLEGVLAGKMTKTNIVGFAGAFPYAAVVSGANAFALGVKSVNPNATVVTNWVNSWYDPPKEKESADALLSAGADIIANHLDSAATLQAAAAQGKWGMTTNADWSFAAPQAFLSGSAWNWGPFYVKEVEAVRANKFEPKRELGDLKSGIVLLLPYGPMVTEEAKQAVESAKQKIMSGELKVFAGPIEDNEGKVRVPAGTELSSEDAATKMNWLVAGVKGAAK